MHPLLTAPPLIELLLAAGRHAADRAEAGAGSCFEGRLVSGACRGYAGERACSDHF
jgi:hypothetical protein